MFGCYSGKIFPSGVAGDTYNKAVESAIQKLRTDQNTSDSDVSDDSIYPT